MLERWGSRSKATTRFVREGATRRRWAAVVAGAAFLGCSSNDRPATAGAGTDPGVVPADAAALRDGATAGDEDASARDGSAPRDAGPPCLADAFENDAGVADGGLVCPTGSCAAACARMLTRYKSGVAQAIVACLAKRTCTNPYDAISCVDLAMARACDDPLGAPLCTPLVAACDPNPTDPFDVSITVDGCARFVAGMTAAGRREYQSCVEAKVTASTCKREVNLCADKLRE